MIESLKFEWFYFLCAYRTQGVSPEDSKILAYLVALSQYGTRIGQPMVKHIEGDIWELRPLRNRIFFFYWKENKIILLHYYIKKSQKMSNKEFKRQKEI